MVELKLCRICLGTDVKMYEYDRYQLKHYYEQVMAIKVNSKDGLPHWFCFECAAMLHKFHKFKEKCYSGQRALKEILWKGPITRELVSKVDRQSKNLQSSLDIINNKRVKICLVQHKTATGKYKKQIIQTADPVIESYLSEDIHDESIADNATIIDNPIDVEKKEIEDVKIEIDDIKINIDEEVGEVPVEIKDNILEVHEKVLPVKDKIDIDDTNTIFDNHKVSNDAETALPLIKNTNKLKRKRQNNEKIKYIITYNKNYKRKKTEDKSISKMKKIRNRTTNFVNEDHWQKLNLTEEEAEKEFQARSECPTYLKSSYKCTYCMRGFSELNMFDRHMKLRHSETGRPFECHFCHVRLRIKCELTRHLRQHYVIYKCMRCNLRFYWEGAAIFHNDYHNNVIKTCKHCGKEFRHSSTYYTHLRVHHRSTHVCAFCGAAFVSESGLLKHTKMKHTVLAEDKSTEEEGKYCEQCDIKFVTLEAYNRHLSQSALHPECKKDREVAPKKKTPHPISNKRKRLQKIPTTCIQCGKHFSSQIGWRRHHKAEHNDVPYAQNDRRICEVCGASLALASMQSHMNTHTRKMTYSCPTCGMTFVSKQNMMRHQLRHTGEKPVKCRVVECDKRFTQVASMNLHYRTFHLRLPYPKRNRRKKNE